MASHSWEDRVDDVQHTWDTGSGDDHDVGSFWGECSDDECAAEDADTPGKVLVDLLLEHMLYSRISSRQCCTLMYWAAKAGIAEATPYSLHPNSSGGHAARKLRASLGHTASDALYEASVPGHSRHDLERTLHTVPFMPLHEQIASNSEVSSASASKLLELKASGDLPEAYTRHPVVSANAGEPVLPLAIFMDAVPYSHTDSVLGCWGVDVLAGRRFLFGCLRKKKHLQVRTQRVVYPRCTLPTHVMVVGCSRIEDVARLAA
jgi:hypothetical protein